jgi:hypothetical protein
MLKYIDFCLLHFTVACITNRLITFRRVVDETFLLPIAQVSWLPPIGVLAEVPLKFEYIFLLRSVYSFILLCSTVVALNKHVRYGNYFFRQLRLLPGMVATKNKFATK